MPSAQGQPGAAPQQRSDSALVSGVYVVHDVSVATTAACRTTFGAMARICTSDDLAKITGPIGELPAAPVTLHYRPVIRAAAASSSASGVFLVDSLGVTFGFSSGAPCAYYQISANGQNQLYGGTCGIGPLRILCCQD